MGGSVATAKRPPRAKRPAIYLRVIRGGLEPADGFARDQLRSKGYRVGDVLRADLAKLRNPGFNRLVHRIGQLCVANVEAFHGMDAHACIKRLQLEGGIACDEIAISMRRAWDQFAAAILSVPGTSVIAPALQVVGSMLPEDALVVMRTPRSLSFDSLDEGEYREVARAICRLIAARYWQTLTPELIEEMAETFVGE